MFPFQQRYVSDEGNRSVTLFLSRQEHTAHVQAELHQGVPDSPAQGMLNSRWGRAKGHCIFKGNRLASERGKKLKKHL